MTSHSRKACHNKINLNRVSKVSVIAPLKAFSDIKMWDVDAKPAEEAQKYNHLYDSSLKKYKNSVRTSNS